MSRGIAARDNYPILLFKRQLLYSHLLCGIEKHVGRCKRLAHRGDNAPRKRKLSPRIFIGRKSYDRHGCAEARDHSCRHSRQRARNYCLCFNVYRHSAGRVRYCVGHISYLEIRLVKSLSVIYALLYQKLF